MDQPIKTQPLCFADWTSSIYFLWNCINSGSIYGVIPKCSHQLQYLSGSYMVLSFDTSNTRSQHSIVLKSRNHFLDKKKPLRYLQCAFRHTMAIVFLTAQVAICTKLLKFSAILPKIEASAILQPKTPPFFGLFKTFLGKAFSCLMYLSRFSVSRPFQKKKPSKAY